MLIRPVICFVVFVLVLAYSWTGGGGGGGGMGGFRATVHGPATGPSLLERFAQK
jgi:hypothetical protein